MTLTRQRGLPRAARGRRVRRRVAPVAAPAASRHADPPVRRKTAPPPSRHVLILAAGHTIVATSGFLHALMTTSGTGCSVRRTLLIGRRWFAVFEFGEQMQLCPFAVGELRCEQAPGAWGRGAPPTLTPLAPPPGTW